jgi:mannosyltransferase
VNVGYGRIAGIRRPASRLAPPGVRLRSGLVLLAICTVTGVLGLFRVGSKGLWHDEAFGEAMARLDLPSLWSATVPREAFSGLYFVLLHLWLRLGDSETWLRLPSAICGILAAWALFVVTRRLFGQRTATIAGVLLACNAFFVRYEQEARSYTLALLAVLLATYALVRAVDQPSRAHWITYTAAGAFAIYAHFFSAFVIAAHFLSLLLFRPNRLRTWNAWMGYGFMAILVAPLTLAMALNDELQRRAFIPRPTLQSLPLLFLELTGAEGMSRSGRLLLLAYFLACCVGVLVIARGVLTLHEARREGLWPLALMMMWLGVPVLGSLAMSIVQPVFLARYLIIALPPLIILASIGISTLTTPSRALAVAVIVALSAFSLHSYYTADYKNEEDWRRATAYVLANSRPGDQALFLTRYGRRPFEYYARSHVELSRLMPVYPTVEWGEYPPVIGDIKFEGAASAVKQLRGDGRVWAVLLWDGFGARHEEGLTVEKVLDQHYQTVDRRRFGSFLQIRLYAPITS